MTSPSRCPTDAHLLATTCNTHEGARFVLVGAAPDEIVRLLDGALTVEVDPLGPRERFRVVTGDGEVEVRGTAFEVRAEQDQLRAVRVLHGRVVVRGAPLEGEVELGPGQRWLAPPTAPPFGLPTEAPAEAVPLERPPTPDADGAPDE